MNRAKCCKANTRINPKTGRPFYCCLRHRVMHAATKRAWAEQRRKRTRYEE